VKCCRRATWRMTATVATVSSGDSPWVGSSSRRSAGSCATAMAISRRRWSPCGKVVACSAARSMRPGASRLARARRPAASRVARPLAGWEGGAAAHEPEIPPAPELHGHPDVLQHGELGENAGDLERARDAAPAARGSGERGYVLATEENVSRGGREETGDEM